MKVGDKAKVKVFVPDGMVTKRRVLEDDSEEYLLMFKDKDGETQERWFKSGELEVSE
jgi:hypothetical protein